MSKYRDIKISWYQNILKSKYPVIKISQLVDKYFSYKWTKVKHLPSGKLALNNSRQQHWSEATDQGDH